MSGAPTFVLGSGPPPWSHTWLEQAEAIPLQRWHVRDTDELGGLSANEKICICVYQTFSYSKDEVLSCVFSWSLQEKGRASPRGSDI